jgi:hypothetical protein
MKMGLFGLPYFPMWAYFVYFAWAWLALLQGTTVEPTPYSISLAGSVPWRFPDRLATDKIVDQQQASAEPSPFGA